MNKEQCEQVNKIWNNGFYHLNREQINYLLDMYKRFLEKANNKGGVSNE